MLVSSSRVHPIEFNASAIDVAFDEDFLRVRLADGRELSVPLAYFPRLLHATPEQRKTWHLIGHGIGIGWRAIDEHISIAGLLRER